MITKITILLILISLFYPTPTSSAKPPSWFQEKYLNEIYDRYYVYSYETDYQDRVNCLEIHKPAVMAAITGTTFLHKHRVRVKMLPPVKYWKPPKAHYSYIIDINCILDITIRDILVYLSKFLPYISTSVYYIWHTFIVVLYLVLTIPMTVMVLVLFFGQY
jgi:hypothetical protein